MSLKDDIDNRCTLFPNGDWIGCCIWHDWQSADAKQHRSWEERWEADLELARCVSIDRKHPIIAVIMYAGVRAWAHIVWRFVYDIRPNKEAISSYACSPR